MSKYVIQVNVKTIIKFIKIVALLVSVANLVVVYQLMNVANDISKTQSEISRMNAQINSEMYNYSYVPVYENVEENFQNYSRNLINVNGILDTFGYRNISMSVLTPHFAVINFTASDMYIEDLVMKNKLESWRVIGTPSSYITSQGKNDVNIKIGLKLLWVFNKTYLNSLIDIGYKNSTDVVFSLHVTVFFSDLQSPLTNTTVIEGKTRVTVDFSGEQYV